MSNYYGVTTPTDDFIAHYGIKGMKWGVRKAIEKGNSRALDRQYKKASRYMQKLKDKTNVEKQTELSKKHRNNAIAYGALTGLYPAAGFGMTHLSKSGATARLNNMAEILKNIPGQHLVSTTYKDYRPWGALAGVASLGGAIGSGIASHKAKKLTTKEGHAKAVRDLNVFKREMDASFRGTKYGKKKKRR